MRIVISEEHSVYEAFQKYGLCDGDCPCAEIIMGCVLDALARLGYAAGQIGGLHNQAIYCLVHRQSGRTIDLAEAAQRGGIDLEDLETKPEAVRQALLAAGLADVVEELNRLDREEITR